MDPVAAHRKLTALLPVGCTERRRGDFILAYRVGEDGVGIPVMLDALEDDGLRAVTRILMMEVRRRVRDTKHWAAP